MINFIYHFGGRVNKIMLHGHWEYPKEFNVDDWFGFTYRIIDKSSGRAYIGKKQFFAIRRVKVKNRKNRKVKIKESNWKTYTGSSTHLNEDIEKNGIENYTFRIESLHKTKGSLYYEEVRKQITEDVLRAKLNNGEYKFYNKHIGAIKFRPPEELTEETLSKF